MSLNTYSLFYYGHTVTELNRSIDFKEGGGEIQATLNIGEYSPTSYAAEWKRALDAAGGQTYTVTFDRLTRRLSATAANPFEFLVNSGSRKGSTAYTMGGFTGADLTGAATYTGDSPSGNQFEPQFYLQDYLAPEDNEDSVEERVNESAAGVIEVVKFGNRRFTEFNIEWATNKNPTGSSLIQVQADALNNLRNFLRYATTKAPIEFMPNKAAPATFHTLILESTKANKAGTGFKLVERKREKTPGYFDTELLTFRVVD